MGWLDKLLGREKKAAGDVTGDSSMKHDGMAQEQEGMASERADSAGSMADKAGDEARARRRTMSASIPLSAPTRRKARVRFDRAFDGGREPALDCIASDASCRPTASLRFVGS